MKTKTTRNQHPPKVPKLITHNGAGRPRGELVKMPVFDTMAQCAASTGVTMGALQLAKRKGCEAFRHGRVDFAVFVRWFFANAADGGRDWVQENKRLDALIKEVELDELKKHVIDFAVVTQFLNNLIGNCFFGELDRLSQELPPALKGKNEMTIHGECVKKFERIKVSLKKQLDAWERKGAK